MSSSSDRGATLLDTGPLVARFDRLRCLVRCMVVLVCLSQLLEELRHFRLQDNQERSPANLKLRKRAPGQER